MEGGRETGAIDSEFMFPQNSYVEKQAPIWWYLLCTLNNRHGTGDYDVNTWRLGGPKYAVLTEGQAPQNGALGNGLY